MIKRKKIKYTSLFAVLPFMFNGFASNSCAQAPILMDEDDLGFDITEDAFGNKVKTNSGSGIVKSVCHGLRTDMMPADKADCFFGYRKFISVDFDWLNRWFFGGI